MRPRESPTPPGTTAAPPGRHGRPGGLAERRSGQPGQRAATDQLGSSHGRTAAWERRPAVASCAAHRHPGGRASDLGMAGDGRGCAKGSAPARRMRKSVVHTQDRGCPRNDSDTSAIQNVIGAVSKSGYGPATGLAVARLEMSAREPTAEQARQGKTLTGCMVDISPSTTQSCRVDEKQHDVYVIVRP